MKRISPYSLALFLVALMAVSCAKSTEISGLMVSVSELEADQNGNPTDPNEKKLKLIVSSDEQWSVESNSAWLSTNAQMGGISRTVVGVKVDPNILGKERSGKLTFSTSKAKVEVTIKQLGGEGIDPETVIYELPVIFHVLYNEADKLNPDTLKRKYVLNSTEAQTMLNYVNRRYGERPEVKGNEIYRGIKRNYQATDDVYYLPKISNIRFVLATEDPQGNRISPAGIDAVAMEERSLEPSDVMGDKAGGRFHSMAWPIKKYINVYVFPFTKHGETENQVTLGISHLPFALSSAPIDGLSTLSKGAEDIIKNKGGLDAFSNYNHCVVINSDAFEWRLWRYTFLKADLGMNTVAHELGHYLGLFHTFSEMHDTQGELILDSCEDTDYCDDTRSYNRYQYEKSRQDIIASGETPFVQIKGLLQRNDCNGGRFESTNIMDYDFTYSDEFTPQQIRRMRKVLYNSYTTPGIKLVTPRSAVMGIPGVPVMVEGSPRAVKCTTISPIH